MSLSDENPKKGVAEEVKRSMKNQINEKKAGTTAGASIVGRTTKTTMKQSKRNPKKEVIDIS